MMLQQKIRKMQRLIKRSKPGPEGGREGRPSQDQESDGPPAPGMYTYTLVATSNRRWRDPPTPCFLWPWSRPMHRSARVATQHATFRFPSALAAWEREGPGGRRRSSSRAERLSEQAEAGARRHLAARALTWRDPWILIPDHLNP